jgi:integrase
MPRSAKGARLWLQPGRPDRNERAVWVIRDAGRKHSTGFGQGDAEKAQRALADYIIAKSSAPRARHRDPAQVRIADVITIYAQDVVPRHVSPPATAARLAHLLDYFGAMTLDDLNKRSCAAYTTARGLEPSARRELEDLRAAVRYHWQAGLCSGLTPVTLPDKSPPRERWLTRSEAARLLWAAWRHRDQRSNDPNMRHVARFVLVALYTGTRAGAVCNAALAPTDGRGWIDLDQGVFYRRAQGRRETKKRQPPVRLPPRLLTHLRRWQRLRLSTQFAVECTGHPVKWINYGFGAVRAAAGLSDVTPHTLRHTCATWLAQRGVPVWEAAGYLGMTAETFERVYGHHHPDHQAQAVAAFGRQARPDENTRRVANMWKGR